MREVAASVVLLLCATAMAADFPQFTAERLPGNPIISARTFADAGIPDDGKNINGPSMIRVPDWVPTEKRADPKANYYLYFAHHQGLYIRMAWAEKVEGPYTLYEPGKGVLSLNSDKATKRPRGKGTLIMLADGLALGGHIASPDVHVDHQKKRIVMLFHGFEESRGEEGKHQFPGPDGKMWSRKEPQKTFAAVSDDALSFNNGLQSHIVSQGPYLRAYELEGKYYGSAFSGIHRTTDPQDITSEYRRIALFSQWVKGVSPRHSAARVANNGDITIFYSSFGGEPEHIEYLTIRGVGTTDRATKWSFSKPASLLKPERDWEGANLPNIKSEKGEAEGAVHQLRDPAIFRDRDGTEYILYSIAGENGIAIAKLVPVTD